MEKKKTAKEYLKESAIELLSKGRVEKISVRDIAANCGVSTRTFYNYFKDKNDLFLYIYTSALEDFYQEHKDGITFEPFMWRTGELLWEYKRFFQNFQAYVGQNSFRDSVVEPLVDFYERIIRETFHDEITEDLHYAVMLFVMGECTFVSWSYQQPSLMPLEQGIPLFMEHMPEVLKKYL